MWAEIKNLWNRALYCTYTEEVQANLVCVLPNNKENL